ncbi:hypothetical protein J0H58_07775 [bacterium]|nr:hypothetical protein [bacterium]
MAARATAEHKKGERAGRQAISHFINAGKALVKAKQLLKDRHGTSHGHWLPWLAQYAPGIPQPRASEYMRLAKHHGKLPRAGNLSLRVALAHIKKPGVTRRPRGGQPGVPPPRTWTLELSPAEYDEAVSIVNNIKHSLSTKTDGATVLEVLRRYHKGEVVRVEGHPG